MLPTERPHYKLIITYDIRPEMMGEYQFYVLNDFIPALNEMQFNFLGAWHTAYGQYPVRLIEFGLEDLNTFYRVVRTSRWQEAEDKLKSYTVGYKRKLVPYRSVFQF